LKLIKNNGNAVSQSLGLIGRNPLQKIYIFNKELHTMKNLKIVTIAFMIILGFSCENDLN